MQRYHDVISSFGGKTSYDADNRPLLVMRSNRWASGYDVDGTDRTSLGQFSARVQQTYKHSVPRFFVPEHGTMFTIALVRFPPTATKEIQFFFFQAEDGIRDIGVTGVQTCALPISSATGPSPRSSGHTLNDRSVFTNRSSQPARPAEHSSRPRRPARSRATSSLSRTATASDRKSVV